MDLNYFQQIKNIAIANIPNIEQSETLDISVFNLTEDMTKEQKCLKNLDKSTANGTDKLTTLMKTLEIGQKRWWNMLQR